jgi:hypothetical protein
MKDGRLLLMLFVNLVLVDTTPHSRRMGGAKRIRKGDTVPPVALPSLLLKTMKSHLHFGGCDTDVLRFIRLLPLV